jgi:hypothetical protein
MKFPSVGPEGIVNLSSRCEVWHTRRMKTPASDNRYKNHRFPAEIISHGVWLYFRFCLTDLPPTICVDPSEKLRDSSIFRVMM